MNRTLITTLVSASAALLLTACGGGDGGSDDSGKKIEGAESETASPSPSRGAGRPTIKLPKDLKLVFEDTETGDKTKDAVLADSAERIRAMDEAIANGRPDSPAVLFYSHRLAQVSAQKSIKWYKDKDYALTGTFRYFDRKVTFNDDKTASVTYCGDESKGFAKERKSSKVLKTPVSETAYVLYEARLKKNSDGVWQTSDMRVDRGAAECQP